MLITLLLTMSFATADLMHCPASLSSIAVDGTEPWPLLKVGRVFRGTDPLTRSDSATARTTAPGALSGSGDANPTILAVCPWLAFLMPCPAYESSWNTLIVQPEEPSGDDLLPRPSPAVNDSQQPAANRESGAEGAGGEAAHQDSEAVALLRKLEKGGDDLRAFTADIFFEEADALLGDVIRRSGEVIFQADPAEAVRSFAIAFDEVIANNRKREQQKRYVVSGRWLVEIDPEQKLFIKREIVPQGREFDPFKLGEGPVPLPVGQSADEVLHRFEASLAELPETGPLSKLRGKVEVDGLELIPKPGRDVAEEFERIELFYDRATLLPVGVNVIEVNGDRKTARLDNVRRNPQLTEQELEKLDITEPDPREWRIDIQPLDR